MSNVVEDHVLFIWSGSAILQHLLNKPSSEYTLNLYFQLEADTFHWNLFQGVTYDVFSQFPLNWHIFSKRSIVCSAEEDASMSLRWRSHSCTQSWCFSYLLVKFCVKLKENMKMLRLMYIHQQQSYINRWCMVEALVHIYRKRLQRSCRNQKHMQNIIKQHINQNRLPLLNEMLVQEVVRDCEDLDVLRW